MNMMSEFVVIEGSPLIGLKLEDLVSKYGVEVLHFHNPSFDSETKIPYQPSYSIQKNSLIKVSGEDENVRQLRLESVNYH